MLNTDMLSFFVVAGYWTTHKEIVVNIRTPTRKIKHNLVDTQFLCSVLRRSYRHVHVPGSLRCGLGTSQAGGQDEADHQEENCQHGLRAGLSPPRVTCILSTVPCHVSRV